MNRWLQRWVACSLVGVLLVCGGIASADDKPEGGQAKDKKGDVEKEVDRLLKEIEEAAGDVPKLDDIEGFGEIEGLDELKGIEGLEGLEEELKQLKGLGDIKELRGLLERLGKGAQGRGLQFRILGGDGAHAAAGGHVSQYWIGGYFEPISGALRAQLDLEHGLVASQIVKDSPAGKAGLKQFDVLLRLDDVKLDKVETLIGAIDKAKGKAVKITFLRAGSERTAKVTPAKRPKGQVVDQPVGDLDLPHSFRWLPDMHQLDKDGLRLMFVKPGVQVGEGFPAPRIPGDLRITVERDGNKPAKITVRRGEKSWVVNDKELDKLPKEIRIHVAPLTGKGGFRFELPGDAMKGLPDEARQRIRQRIQVLPGGGGGIGGAIQGRQPRIQVRRFRPGGDQPAEKALESIQRELKELRRELDELKKGDGKRRKKSGDAKKDKAKARAKKDETAKEAAIEVEADVVR